jgi:hypothetical protein
LVTVHGFVKAVGKVGVVDDCSNIVLVEYVVDVKVVLVSCAVLLGTHNDILSDVTR